MACGVEVMGVDGARTRLTENGSVFSFMGNRAFVLTDVLPCECAQLCAYLFMSRRYSLEWENSLKMQVSTCVFQLPVS